MQYDSYSWLVYAVPEDEFLFMYFLETKSCQYAYLIQALTPHDGTYHQKSTMTKNTSQGKDQMFAASLFSSLQTTQYNKHWSS